MARKPQGKFFGLPFNVSPPRRGEAGRGLWDPEDPRLFTPKNYGVGYGLNLAALFHRKGKSRSEPPRS